MARKGRRYSLVLYTLVLDRWWKLTLWIGICLVALALGLEYLPQYYPQFHSTPITAPVFWILVGIGGFSVFVAFFLLFIRRSAYVQPFENYLRLSTPFLRLNISYRRIRQASSLEMGKLFPPEQYKGWQRKFLRPLAGHTLMLVEMNGWPLSPGLLKVFLSPFFFPGKTPRLALLIPRWMEFSTELESLRSAWYESIRGRRQAEPDLYTQVMQGH